MSETERNRRSSQDQRIVKLLLPLPLIRAMDQLLADGVGGFTTRNEFAREALESYILEIEHEPAPAEPKPLVRRGQIRAPLSLTPTLLEPGQPELFDGPVGSDDVRPPRSLEETGLRPLPLGLEPLAGKAQIVEEPLFGMHNRDYPSLWAGRRLADYLVERSLSFDEFAERATEEAWAFADALRALEADQEQKLTALFPTNHQKRQTASSGFRTFAIGSVTASGEEVHAEGPLFLWRMIDVARSDGRIAVGLTEHGRTLLEDLAGLTVAQPHPPEQTRRFIEHLREHARADWWGFEQALAIVAERPTRLELVEAFRSARSDWRDSVAATNAQGYVARAREWGLIAPKVLDGRYELTDLGAEFAKGKES